LTFKRHLIWSHKIPNFQTGLQEGCKIFGDFLARNILVFSEVVFIYSQSSMRFPINIDDVLHGQTVEWERLEFKQREKRESVSLFSLFSPV
jgi:hypothetical protein